MFKFYSFDSARTPVFESHLLTSGVTVAIGEALYFTSGALQLCPATTKPTHIAQQVLTGDGTKLLWCSKVQEGDVYETKSTAAATLGAIVTLHTDALQVTDTTSSGVFQINYVADATATPVVRGRFV